MNMMNFFVLQVFLKLKKNISDKFTIAPASLLMKLNKMDLSKIDFISYEAKHLLVRIMRILIDMFLVRKFKGKNVINVKAAKSLKNTIDTMSVMFKNDPMPYTLLVNDMMHMKNLLRILEEPKIELNADLADFLIKIISTGVTMTVAPTSPKNLGSVSSLLTQSFGKIRKFVKYGQAKKYIANYMEVGESVNEMCSAEKEESEEAYTDLYNKYLDINSKAHSGSSLYQKMLKKGMR